MKILSLLKLGKGLLSKETTNKVIGEVSEGIKGKRIIKLKYKIAVLLIIVGALALGVPKEVVLELLAFFI